MDVVLCVCVEEWCLNALCNFIATAPLYYLHTFTPHHAWQNMATTRDFTILRRSILGLAWIKRTKLHTTYSFAM